LGGPLHCGFPHRKSYNEKILLTSEKKIHIFKAAIGKEKGKETMAHHKSALKRIRQNEKRRLYNRAYKSRMKTEIKKLLAASSKEEAELQFRRVTALLDQMVCKGIIHRNFAANRKSKLAKFVNSMAS
jgi:small subunit ribosomal protein S20